MVAAATAACAELVVRDYIRPAADVLVGILDEMVAADVPQPRSILLGLASSTSACFYRTPHRPIRRFDGSKKRSKSWTSGTLRST